MAAEGCAAGWQCAAALRERPVSERAERCLCFSAFSAKAALQMLRGNERGSGEYFNRVGQR